jgi:nucleoside-diphosphate-sugar epimerase
MQGSLDNLWEIMKVLVTGCGGFLGSQIVRQLMERGDHVVGVARGDYPALCRRGMQQRRGDLVDATFAMESIQGVDAVIHTAAIAGAWGRWDEFFAINKTATDNVIAACQANGIRILIFTSSPSVTFDGQDQAEVDESIPYPTRWLCHYQHTKALAEMAVREAHQPGRLETVSLRPHLIWGEDDPHLFPRVLARARQGRLRIVGDGANLIDTVHVINAAGAHLDALDAAVDGAPDIGGRAFFITQDEPVHCWEWIGQICELAGVQPPRRRISFAAAYALGGTLEAIYRVTGRTSEPPMTRFVAAQLAKHHYFDITAAKSQLGYLPRITMFEGLARLKRAWRS